MAEVVATKQRSMTGGEQSPNLDARADLARWATAMRTIENWIVRLAGGAERCPGTRDVYAAQDNSRLVEFAFGNADGYAVEAAPAPAKLRFFRDFGILTTDGTTPYEIDSPFTLDEVGRLYGAQSANWLFLASGSRQIQQLQRNDTLNWTIAAAAIRNGPFRTMNLDQTQILYTTQALPIVAGTAFTLKARGATPFVAGHVGALFRLRIPDQQLYQTWTEGVDYGVGDQVVWDGNWYQCTFKAGAGSGPNPPVHLFGQAWDGSGSARAWQYLHSGFGLVQVTGFTDSATLSVTAIGYIPDDLHGSISTGGTWRWEEGCWSDYRGYPQVVVIHKKRLYALFNAAQPTTGWAGVIDDYSNFDDSSTDDDKAFAFDLEANSGEVNVPRWAVSGKRLALGTAGNEFVVTSADVTSPITTKSVDPETATGEGSAPIVAINVDGPVFVSADKKRLHQLGYDLQRDDYVAPDLTLFADHIAGAGNVGFEELVWLRDPYRLIVARRTDGALAICTFRKDQDVNAWQRRTFTKGAVKSICRCKSPSGVRQDLWLIVERPLAAGTVRRVESLTPFFERGDLSSTSAWFMDGGFQYSGAPAASIIGIPPHMIGETVKVRADGQNRPDCLVVPDGAGKGKIVLDRTASLVTLGFGYRSTLTSLRYDARLEGRNARIQSVVVDALNAGQLWAQANDSPAQLLSPSGDADVDTSQPIVTTILGVEDPLPSDWNDAGQFTVYCEDTGPATIRALTPIRQVAT